MKEIREKTNKWKVIPCSLQNYKRFKISKVILQREQNWKHHIARYQNILPFSGIVAKTNQYERTLCPLEEQGKGYIKIRESSQTQGFL